LFKVFFKFGSFLLGVIILFCLCSPVSATVLFEDNFDTDSGKWEEYRSTCHFPNLWTIANGVCKIEISNFYGSCSTEYGPKEEYWDDTWVNYKIEVDMYFVDGVDKNLAWRYISGGEWYDVHFYSGGLDIEASTSPNLIATDNTFYPNNLSIPYHITIIVDGNNFFVYVNDVLKVSGTDAGNRFPSGPVALRGSVGAVKYSKVWFDNLRVTTLDHVDPDRTPIVILPGLMGSFNAEAIISGGNGGDWGPLPSLINPYEKTIQYFESSGYELGTDLFVKYYDWRKSLDDLDDELASYLVGIGEPVNLIGHSYGGLLAKKYLQEYGDVYLNKVVTLGSPSQGILQVYPLWGGGQIEDMNIWEKVGLETLLRARAGLFKIKRDLIHEEIPSLGEILPTFDYLEQSGIVIAEAGLNERNLILPGLGVSESFRDNYWTVAGDGQSTWEWIEVEDTNWYEELLGLWPDGKFESATALAIGDGTVLKSSALISEVNQWEVMANHGELVIKDEVLDKVADILGIDQGSVTGDLGDSLVVAMVRSPAEINLLGETGKLVVVEIPSEKFKLEVVGTGEGDYVLEVGQYLNGESKWHSYQGEISQGEIDDWWLEMDQGELTERPLEANYQDYLAQADLVLGSMSNTYEVGKMRRYLSVIDDEWMVLRLLQDWERLEKELIEEEDYLVWRDKGEKLRSLLEAAYAELISSPMDEGRLAQIKEGVISYASEAEAEEGDGEATASGVFRLNEVSQGVGERDEAGTVLDWLFSRFEFWRYFDGL
jgi:pimeloyl-ACP methyl ester carboxylesterase